MTPSPDKVPSHLALLRKISTAHAVGGTSMESITPHSFAKFCAVGWKKLVPSMCGNSPKLIAIHSLKLGYSQTIVSM